MLQISEIVKKTEEMFDLFNGHFYDNELTRPAITVSPDGGRGAYGWCSINEIWNASGEKYREINLCAEYLDRPIFELTATLLHEMAHLYNLVHDIQDVSNNGYYHNMKFKATAEAHGLHIEKHQKYGWTVTTLAPEAEAYIRVYHSNSSKEAYLFSTTIKGVTDRMSVGNVQRIIKKYAALVSESGISLPDSVHCHMFRRTRATNLYQDGIAIELVSTVLGHARTDTTKSYYAKPSIEQLRDAMESVPTPASDEVPMWEGNEDEMARLCGLR